MSVDARSLLGQRGLDAGVVFVPDLRGEAKPNLAEGHETQTEARVSAPSDGRYEHAAIKNDGDHPRAFRRAAARAAPMLRSTSSWISGVMGSCGSAAMISSNRSTLGPTSSRARARSPARITSLAFP